MNLAPGVRLGPYEIVAPIGAGGMGEVYRARDTRLDRTVAIKVLPAAFAQSAQLRLRFEREARAISSLTHPNICTLHDIGSHDGIEYLVMEHLEGESLADRLARGALPVDDAVRYAIEIADALDKAHRRGIVHRDLKPGNVMMTKSGAKLLDFGLARSIDPEPISADSATVAQKPLTEEGTIVGTVQYMAPEQLESRPADARTDIFAFGALLYEMLTGRRAFGGKSRASVIAAILAAEPPPVSQLRPLTPRPLERIVRICLAKDPDERWQSMHDVKLELEGLSSIAEAAPRGRFAKAGWLAAALIAAAAVIWFAVDRRAHDQPRQSVRFEIAPPGAARFDVTNTAVAVSPDGRTLALGVSAGNDRTLALRRLDRTSFERLPGTGRAYDLFWSSDGRQLGFFQDGKLRRIDLASKAVVTIATAADSRGATWAGDTILFSPSYYGPILRVSARGGTARPVTKLDAARKEVGHARPWFLPDGKHFLFTAYSADQAQSATYLGSLESAEVRRVLDVATTVQYASPGRLLYVHDGTLYAQPFDASSGTTTGTPAVVARDVEYSQQFSLPGFSAGGNVIAWHPRAARRPIVRIAPDGTTSFLSETGENLDLAPDGSRLGFMYSVSAQRNPDIWIHDFRRGMRSRVTFDEAAEVGPVWSPDGRRVAYETLGTSGSAVKIAFASGTGPVETVVQSPRALEPVAWSPDGKFILCEGATEGNQMDIMAIDVAARKVAPLVSTPFSEGSARFSPDGKWIAYESDESGQSEIYLQPFPPEGTKVQVTSGGGFSPRWLGGGVLYFARPDASILSVAISHGPNGVEIGPPRLHARAQSYDYVVSPRGEIFASSNQAVSAQPIVVHVE